MRQPGSSRRTYAEQGYHGKPGGGGRNPDIVVNGRSQDSSDSMGSGGQRGTQSPHGLDDLSPTKMGAASNPNRADIPATNKRKGSYDPVSLREGGRGGGGREGEWEDVHVHDVLYSNIRMRIAKHTNVCMYI